jgi:NarL family two-component system response regulator LiaR
MKKVPKIKVMLVDDHDMVREGVGFAIETMEGIELTGKVKSGEEALATCRQNRPDVILMDIVMPGMDGIETTRQIKAICPKVQIVILTSFRDSEYIHPALKAGATGYVLKNSTVDELEEVIKKAHKHQSTYSSEVEKALEKDDGA